MIYNEYKQSVNLFKYTPGLFKITTKYLLSVDYSFWVYYFYMWHFIQSIDTIDTNIL